MTNPKNIFLLDETDDDKSSSDEGSDDDDDEGGIIISFGAGSSIDQPKPKPAIVTAGSPGSSQPKTKSPKVISNQLSW